MSRGSFRVYVVRDERGLFTVRPMSRAPFGSPISASGQSEQQALERLETALASSENLDRELALLLWDEEFRTSKVSVEVRPEAVVQKRRVIARERVPIELTYAWSELSGDDQGGESGYRVLLPRFGWAFTLEDLSIAHDVLRQTVSSALAGENARLLFEFRELADEYVISWAPKLLRRKKSRSSRTLEAFPTLNAVAEDFTTMARRGQLGTHLGEVDASSYAPLLRGDRKPSLLIVGPAGVGKTSWVKEFARRSAQAGSETRIWATSADRIVAGMSYLGMWEQRCLDIVSELSGEGHYLYVDRLSSFVESRSLRSSIAELMLPAIRAGEISIIAECSEEELQRAQLASPALVSCARIIRLEPPSREVTVQRMLEYQARNNPQLSLHLDAVRRVVRHLTLYRKDTAFPGKAFAFLNWLKTAQGTATVKERKLLARDADREFSRYSGLSERLISEEFIGDSETIAKELERGVIGQQAACRACAEVVTRFKAGINDPEKPIASLLFVGPTGVGKTELAKQLARFLFGSSERMIRLDMSEYMLPYSTERLVADERQANSLAVRVSQEPLSLILLDEIEKAHAAVFDLLLGVLGEGRLTTQSGRLVDFRMTLIVMTSNLGIGGVRVGFNQAGSGTSELMRAVQSHFRPEFFNRLDYVVPFSNLSLENIREIVRLELDKLRAREGLRRRNIELSVSDAAVEYLAQQGFHPKFGARPLTRVIEERVMTPIAVELARKPKLTELKIRVDIESAELQVSFL